MTDGLKVYWDACAWLGLLNQESDKRQGLETVWRMAERGEVEIWTSAFCIAEVYKVKCEGDWASLSPENDASINNLFDQDFVKIVQLDSEIAKLAKTQLRTHEKLKKPSDAVHLATAMYWDLDQFHTYDGSDLLGLSVKTVKGKDLSVCRAEMILGPDLLNMGSTGQNK